MFFPGDNGRTDHAYADRERSSDSPREPHHDVAPRNEETQSLVEGDFELRGAQEARRARLILVLLLPVLRCSEGMWLVACCSCCSHDFGLVLGVRLFLSHGLIRKTSNPCCTHTISFSFAKAVCLVFSAAVSKCIRYLVPGIRVRLFIGVHVAATIHVRWHLPGIWATSDGNTAIAQRLGPSNVYHAYQHAHKRLERVPTHSYTNTASARVLACIRHLALVPVRAVFNDRMK